MSWIELSLDTTSEAVDWVRTLLATTAAVGDLHITAQDDGWMPPELATAEANWAYRIQIYLSPQQRSQAAAIAERLAPLHRTGLTTEITQTIVETKPASSLSLMAQRIGQRFVVVPPNAPERSQSDALPTAEIPLTIGTTLSFGSGLHPATRLTLQLLERQVGPRMQAVDLGSGSGILSVAMAKLGAQVLAIDNDPIAVQATQETVRQNGVESQVTVRQGSLGCGSALGHWMGGDAIAAVPTIAAPAHCDLIVANILARVHIALASDYQAALQAASGLLITAGFTADYEAAIRDALAAVGFEAIDAARSCEWVAIAHRLR